MSSERSRSLPPLSLYLHFPWCIAKCPYCDFNSHTLRGELPATAYIDALLLDLHSAGEHERRRPLQSVFLGGGTPSLFPPDQLARLLDAVRAIWTLEPAAEITLEANPGALEHGAFAGYLAAGINRLSLGVQSFSDRSLQRLGRIHSAADAIGAYERARAAGFTNINLDLMFALPEQTAAAACSDIDQAVALAPEHISHYHLTLEPNTVFYAQPPPLPDADGAWEMQEVCAERLTAAGFRNYEISAWGQPGRECRHNLNYWRYGDYLGLGAGAHGKLTDPGGLVERQQRAAHPRAYMQGLKTAGAAHSSAPVGARDRAFEFMLNALRLRDGASVSEFVARTGVPLELLAAELAEARSRGLLEDPATGVLRSTPRGWRFLDDLQAVFLPPAAAARPRPESGPLSAS